MPIDLSVIPEIYDINDTFLLSFNPECFGILKCIEKTIDTALLEKEQILSDLGLITHDSTLLELQKEKILSDLKLITDIKHFLLVVKKSMYTFYIDHSPDNARNVLSALKEHIDVIKTTATKIHTPNTRRLIENSIIEMLESMNDIYTQKFQQLFNPNDKYKLPECLEYIRNIPFMKQYCKVAFNQENNRIIRLETGYCFGISLGVAYDLLRRDKSISGCPDSDLATIYELSNNTLSKIALYQSLNSISNPLYFQEHRDTLDNKKVKMFEDIHVFVNHYDCTYFTAKQFAKNIANSIYNVFSDIQNSEVYTVDLSLSTLQTKGSSHSLNITHTNKGFYFVDANYGLYFFGHKLDELKQFLETYLLKTRYATEFSKYSITNYPLIEQEFKIPQSLKNKEIPNTTTLPINNSKIAHVYDLMFSYKAQASRKVEHNCHKLKEAFTNRRRVPTQ